MEGLNVLKRRRERDVSLDVIRIVALLCVISVHFFLNNGFYKTIVSGEKMYLMTVMRTFFMVCVPLFIILTGYLMRKKKLSKKYYFGIVKTLGIYVLASLACLFFKVVFFDKSYTLFQVVMGIFGFYLADYSWYIEMYIGLFLLIPFLNLIYNNLTDKRQKKVLIFTLLFLTSFPTLTNIFNLNLGISADAIFNDGTLYNQILPFWWKFLYPVTYYFIGAYISEYKVKMNRKLNVLLLMIFLLLFGSYNYFCSYGSTFIWGPYQDWGSIQNIIITVLLFVLLLSFNFNKCSDFSKKVLGKISDLCLGAYLVSCVFDDAFYTILNRNVPVMTDRLNYFIIMIPLVFVCSILLSLFLNCVYSVIYKFFSWLFGIKKVHVNIFDKMKSVVKNFDLVSLNRAMLYLILFLLIVCNFKVVTSVFDEKIHNNVGNSFNDYLDYYGLIEYKDASFIFDKSGYVYLSVSDSNEELKFVKDMESFNYIHGVFKEKDNFEIRNDFGVNAYKFDVGKVVDVYSIFTDNNFIYVLKLDDGYKYIDYNSIVSDKCLSFVDVDLNLFSDIYYKKGKGIFIKDLDGNLKDVTSLFDTSL